MYVKQQKSNNTCPTGNCPEGIEKLKEIGLAPQEKRAIFFRLKQEIFKEKRLRQNLPLF